jgi:hypothetical protein
MIEIKLVEEKPDLPKLNFPYSLIISNYHSDDIDEIYDKGFVPFCSSFKMTRSVRVNISKFNLNSENRRVLRIAESYHLKSNIVEIKKCNFIYDDYFISDCIEFAKKHYVDGGELSKNKLISIYENPLITHVFTLEDESLQYPVGTVFLCKHANLIHYWHAFYDSKLVKNQHLPLGKYLMLSVISKSSELKCKYIYLGAAYDRHDLYKVNDWNGLEWWNGNFWDNDIKLLKKMCAL